MANERGLRTRSTSTGGRATLAAELCLGAAALALWLLSCTSGEIVGEPVDGGDADLGPPDGDGPAPDGDADADADGDADADADASGPTFLLIPHPDDEGSLLPWISRTPPEDLVPVLLTQGDRSGHCSNEALVGDFDRDGDFDVEDCKAKRVASFHQFWDSVGVPAARRFVFDLGDQATTPDEDLAAIDEAAGAVGPPSRIACAFHAPSYPHVDHVSATLAAGRWGPSRGLAVEAVGAGMGLGADSTLAVVDPDRYLACPSGSFQAAYGWLSGRECFGSDAFGAFAHVHSLRQTVRLAGSNRYETAAAVSRHAYPAGAPVVYLVHGYEFPDALAAGSLRDGPVLLAETDVLPPAVAAEIDRLDPARVIGVGGSARLSDAVLAASGRPWSRLAGASRIDTAVAVSQHAFPAGADHVYLADGFEFADALAGGALADGPVLLVDGQAPSLPAAVAAEIDRLAPDRVVALGGALAVSDALLAQAGRPTGRLGGATRIETSVAIAEWARSHGASTEEVVLVDGFDFPDGAAAASLRAPILLTNPSEVNLPIALQDFVLAAQPVRVLVAGGTAAVPDSQLAEAVSL